jgi:DNA-binding NarL/FixJ family response regulator
VSIKILLADDHALLRNAFRALFDAQSDMEVVGEASTGCQALDIARRTRADVVLMDVRMPDLDGVEATRRIRADPALADTAILILTTFENDDYVTEALRAGALGFVGKGISPDDLLAAVRDTAAGQPTLSPTATRALIDSYVATPATAASTPSPPVEQLTPREREIVALIAIGLSNTDIAEKLFIAPLTVKTHAHHAMRKLEARDRAHLVALAYMNGLV